jgi:hypothetical protein
MRKAVGKVTELVWVSVGLYRELALSALSMIRR